MAWSAGCSVNFDVTKIDKHGKLQEEPFSYRETKDGKSFIYWKGKQALVMRGDKAKRFLDRIAVMDTRQAQLLMAKLTTNFKRGNER